MNISKYFTIDNKVSSAKIAKMSDDDIILLKKMTKNLSKNATISNRLKYLHHGQPTDTCICGKKLKFSKNANQVFTKSCGDYKCIPQSYDRTKAIESIKKTKSTKKQASGEYSVVEVKSYVLARLKECKPNYIFHTNEDICLYAKSIAKTNKIKTTKLAFDVVNFNTFIHDNKCRYCDNSTSFISYDKGYSETCNDCRLKKSSIKRVKNKIENILNESDQSMFDFIDTPPVNEGPWTYRCKICYEINKKWVNNGFDPSNLRCYRCKPLSTSNMEYEVIEYIKSLYDGEVIHQYKLNSTKNKTGYKSIDIFLPDLNLGIEMNGLYWHSGQYKQKNDHRDKYIACLDEGIKLIQFTDIDWNEKTEIVKSMILSNIGKTNRIYARKCSIKEISVDEYRKFTNNNHIKGYAHSKYRYGMFFDNKLVSIFSLSKSRFKENSMELVRFCSLLNTTVVGGLSKFITHIERNTSFNEFITYADLHYGNGKSYEKNNLKYLKTTNPNYLYYSKKENRLISRQMCMKHRLKKLFPDVYSDDKTEKQIMIDAGYVRYYDCGNKKFIWRRQ